MKEGRRFHTACIGGVLLGWSSKYIFRSGNRRCVKCNESGMDGWIDERVGGSVCGWVGNEEAEALNTIKYPRHIGSSKRDMIRDA